MNPDLKQLNDRIEKLEKLVGNLSRSSSIDRNVETAFTERLSNAFPNITGTGSASTQNVSVPSTPTSITVPAQPSGTLAIKYKGSTYNLLYK